MDRKFTVCTNNVPYPLLMGRVDAGVLTVPFVAIIPLMIAVVSGIDVGQVIVAHGMWLHIETM